TRRAQNGMVLLSFWPLTKTRPPEMRRVRDELKERGLEVTSRWIEGKYEALEGQPVGMNRSFAVEDIEDLTRAAVVIWFSDTDQTRPGRGGRHVEFGVALMLQIQIIVVGP